MTTTDPPTPPSYPVHPQPGPQPVMSLAYQSGDYQMMRDTEHLRLLALFHYIYGAIVMAFACLGLLYVGIGTIAINNPKAFAPPPTARPGQAGPPFTDFAWFFVGMGSAVVLIGWTIGLLTILAGRCVKRRRGYVFVLVMAGINCLWVPIGTVMGVFTFLVLLRDSVRPTFGKPIPAVPTPSSRHGV